MVPSGGGRVHCINAACEACRREVSPAEDYGAPPDFYLPVECPTCGGKFTVQRHRAETWRCPIGHGPFSRSTALVLTDPEGAHWRLEEARYDASLSRDARAALRDAMMIDDAIYTVGERLRAALKVLFPLLGSSVATVTMYGWGPTAEDIRRTLAERYHPHVASWAANEHIARHVARHGRRRLTSEPDDDGAPF